MRFQCRKYVYAYNSGTLHTQAEMNLAPGRPPTPGRSCAPSCDRVVLPNGDLRVISLRPLTAGEAPTVWALPFEGLLAGAHRPAVAVALREIFRFNDKPSKQHYEPRWALFFLRTIVWLLKVVMFFLLST